MIGKLIGNYRIVTELGGGAMGQVYFAEHVVMGRRAAIKVIRDELSTHEESIQRFINEARLVNRIGHPNIVEITDFGQIDSRYYIIMELLEGETLEEHLERVGHLDEATAVPWIVQVADAVRAAHELGVVHRDLKPENIYLAQRPGYEGIVVKVLDFGIAKLMHGPNHSETSTSPGAVLGTPHYMSPEQCEGAEGLDHRSDVYALGVVLYRMLTGTVPFSGDTIIQIMSGHMLEPPPAPRGLRPEISTRMERVILKALEKKPEHRYGDMLALRLALENKLPVVHATQPKADAAVKPAEVDAGGARRVGDRLAQILLERIHKGTLRLPAMPGAARECLRLLDAPEQALDRVVRVIANDPIIAPQVMRRARSALLGGTQPVRTLDQAVSRLGVRELREIVLDISARQLFQSKNAAIRKLTKNLWEHSVAVGVLARAIAKRRKDLDPEAAYLAGLLHDVGKPVAAALLLDAERSLDAPQEAWLGSDAWLGVITECHREVGVALARSWDMHEDVLLAIARSERYTPDNPGSVTSVVCFANTLAKHAGIYAGPVDKISNEALLREGQNLFKADETMVASLLAELRKQSTAGI
ncbi:MAG: hypothetical protein RL701_1868 [Pseudomonadota bacterium]